VKLEVQILPTQLQLPDKDPESIQVKLKTAQSLSSEIITKEKHKAAMNTHLKFEKSCQKTVFSELSFYTC